MESAHSGEICGESFAVSGFKLLDEELDVGGDNVFRGLRLGGRGKGGDVGFCCAVHGGFALLGSGFWLFRVESRHPYAERLLAKAGVASCKGRGVPTLGEQAKPERKGRSAAEVCTSEARKIGEAPCGARSGRSPLARLVFRALHAAACLINWRALREGTAR
jgi:hypothetical protein